MKSWEERIEQSPLGRPVTVGLAVFAALGVVNTARALVRERRDGDRLTQLSQLFQLGAGVTGLLLTLRRLRSWNDRGEETR